MIPGHGASLGFLDRVPRFSVWIEAKLDEWPSILALGYEFGRLRGPVYNRNMANELDQRGLRRIA